MFTYDGAFDGAAPQHLVYERAVRPVVDAFLTGINGD